jgi:ubiquitin carboxyl-terminal hydrolase 8
MMNTTSSTLAPADPALQEFANSPKGDGPPPPIATRSVQFSEPVAPPQAQIEHYFQSHNTPLKPDDENEVYRRGLTNIGNTCYLNSAIQALRYSTGLKNFFLNGDWEKHRHYDRKGHALLTDFADLVRRLWGDTDTVPERTITPITFANTFVRFAQEYGSDEIVAGAQGDSAEAIQIILDGIHTQLAREVQMNIHGDTSTPERTEYTKSLESWASFFRKEYSEIVNQYYGQTQTRIQCIAPDCCNTSTNYEPWAMLKVPIPGGNTPGEPAPPLRTCIAAAFETEIVEDFTCSKCKKKGTTRITHSISRFPRHLILCLKRFTNEGAKIRARIPYNEHHISLASHITWPSLQDEGCAKYRVVSTIEHHGSTHGGHYAMRARDTVVKDIEGKKVEENHWFVYDDSSCYTLTAGGDATPDTYILFLDRLDQ